MQVSVVKAVPLGVTRMWIPRARGDLVLSELSTRQTSLKSH